MRPTLVVERDASGARLTEEDADLGVLGEAARVLFREEELCVGDDVELALAAGLNLGLVLCL
jgi:hypothetical protein